MEIIESIIAAITNNGVAVAMIVWFIYRDNKFLSSLDVTLATLQKSTDSVKALLEKVVFKP